MKDGYDVATALKDVERAMPEAGKLIREYIKRLKTQIVQVDQNEEDTEQESNK